MQASKRTPHGSSLRAASRIRTVLAVALLGTAHLARAQSRSEAPYWADRKAVVVAVTWDKELRFTTAAVVADHGRPGMAESLLVAAHGWPLPDWLRPPPGRAAGRAYTVCVPFVTDRTESVNPNARHLPGAIRTLVSRGLFAAWLQEVQRSDSLAGWEDFVSGGARTLADVSSIARAYDYVNAPDFLQKKRFEILTTSPGGRWILDPMQGGDVDSLGCITWDVDVGFRVYDATSGALVLHDVWTSDWITLATWASDSCFVMAGSATVDWGCDIPVRAPVIWIGDPFARTLTPFLGVSLSPWTARRTWDGWNQVFRKAYPKIRNER
jgi:hypothetical protein